MSQPTDDWKTPFHNTLRRIRFEREINGEINQSSGATSAEEPNGEGTEGPAQDAESTQTQRRSDLTKEK